MFFIVKLSPEIIIKSKPVRKQMSSKLKKNLSSLFRSADIPAEVTLHWDKLTVAIDNKYADIKTKAVHLLQHTTGIAHFLDVTVHEFIDFDETAKLCIALFADEIHQKSFVVRCKRSGKHNFTSHELEQQVGGRILQTIGDTKVSLKNPDFTVQLELTDDKLYLINKKIKGLGGFPMGEVEPVLSLISGGFDSSVSSYMTMRRGMPTHFCFFNLGGIEHEIAVKEIAYYLWQHYGSGVRVKFISVPFEEVVAEILTKVTNSQMGVILKRMMMRAASEIAAQYNIHALVTGEAVAQVSSQTLINLSVIDKVTDTLILRPLITADKEEIIATARKIGTEAFSAVIPEYCGVISVKPTTRAKLPRILAEEENFDFSRLNDAVKQAKFTLIDSLSEKDMTAPVVPVEATPAASSKIIDIRHPNDTIDNPLKVDGVTVQAVPFYTLNTFFETQDKAKHYLLYCDKGVMSKLHASYLIEKGFNVGLYNPDSQ